MEINWFTVIAQLINFFILVWLLKRFLYKPILNAIDERENKITAQLKAAQVTKEEARKEQEDFQQKNSRFDEEKKKRMNKVVEDTDAAGQKLIEQAHEKAEALTAQLNKAREEEQHNQHLELNRKITEEVMAISRKTLTDLANIELEDQLVEVFIKRLKALNGKELKKLKLAFESNKEHLLLRSAFSLPLKQQKMLKKVLDEALFINCTIKFEESPALIGGIELSTPAYKLAWSIAEYLHAYEETIAQTNTVKQTPVLEKQDV